MTKEDLIATGVLLFILICFIVKIRIYHIKEMTRKKDLKLIKPNQRFLYEENGDIKEAVYIANINNGFLHIKRVLDDYTLGDGEILEIEKFLKIK